MKNNVKIEHPYSIKEFIIEEVNQIEHTMFIINLPTSRVNIDWVEATWRSDLDKLKVVEMFYSQQSYLKEDGSIETMFPFEDVKAKRGEFDTVILISEENKSSFGSRVARMLANEILLTYVSVFKNKIDEYISRI